MTILLVLFGIMVLFSSLKIIIKLFWSIMAPISTFGAMIIVVYLFSLMVGK